MRRKIACPEQRALDALVWRSGIASEMPVYEDTGSFKDLLNQAGFHELAQTHYVAASVGSHGEMSFVDEPCRMNRKGGGGC